jgi:dipeptide/tripeptide permease
MAEKTDATKTGLRSFPRTFWAACIMELFERGAYYGMNSILAIYLTNKMHEGGLGFTKESVGFMQASVYALTYIFPILGGALAERFGYRKMLVVAFAFMTAAYAALFQVDTYALVFMFLLLMATGSGLFKPIISGTVARTTTDENSGFGFGVYYWSINLGALIAPLVVTGLTAGEVPYNYIFAVSAVYVGLMFLPVAIMYKEPPKPESTKGLKEFVSGMFLVLRDSRFMLMIFIYSTFWILYFQNFGTVLWYLREYIDAAPVTSAMNLVMDYTVNLVVVNVMDRSPVRVVFGPELVTSINAGTIVLLQFLVSKIVKDRAALPTMIVGIVFGACGFLILALTSSAWMLVLGIAVFSIGEMTCHPKYYSYIGIVAPQDKKAIYMGYAFFYGIIGSGVGSNAGAVAYEYFAAHGGSIKPLWWICAGLGVGSSLLMLAYNAVFSKDTPQTNRLARVAVGFVYGLLIVAGGVVAWKVLSTTPIAWKHVVTSTIMILIGIGGLILTLTGKGEGGFSQGGGEAPDQE